jgi:uncharacterized protein
MFDALAAGGGGPEAMQQLTAAQYSKHVLLLLDVARSGEARAGYELLAAVQRRDPGAARTVMRHPAVGAWAQHVIRAARNHPALPSAEPGWLCAVAAAAAIRARMPAQITVPVTGGMVMLPSLGAVRAAGSTATVRIGYDGRAVVSAAGAVVELPSDPHQEALGWQPLRRVRPGRRDLIIDDLDPFRMPALTTLAPRLTAAQADQWVAALADAWSLLGAHHHEVAAEVEAVVTTIVPHANPERGYSSSTTAETFGAIALSTPGDPCLAAESLTHEVQHLKLFALQDVITLALPDDGQRYYAPWRPDPRPLGGLLQGAYAFLGVSGFWRRQRTVTEGLHAHAEFSKWLGATAQVVQTLLASGRLTEAGEDFVRGMARTVAGWQDDPVPAQAQAAAAAQAAAHQTRWQADNGRPVVPA